MERHNLHVASIFVKNGGVDFSRMRDFQSERARVFEAKERDQKEEKKKLIEMI